jgi:hypothetical protein
MRLREELVACWRDVVDGGGCGRLRPACPGGRRRRRAGGRPPHRQARAVGLDSLRLEARGGARLESFYGRYGWVVTGCWPGALQIAEDDRRDEVLMGLHLRA